jgi:hypothetical protein
VQNAGILAPFTTIMLVFVTLVGALPVECYVVRRSIAGENPCADSMA